MSKVLRYPLDSSRHTSSIVFKINTYSNSKIGFQADGESVKSDPLSSSLSDSLSRGPRGANSAMSKLGDFIKSSSVIDKAQEWFPQKKRLDTVISLYMPHSVATEYGASYSEIEAGGWLGSILKDVADGTAIGEAMNNLGSGFARKLASEAATVGLSRVTSDARALVGKMTRSIENPRKEIVFEGMTIRRFQFSFDFLPRNLNETEEVQEIIKLFKLHMHPDINNSTTSNGMYLTYPNDFDIEFTYTPKDKGDKPNPWAKDKGDKPNPWVNRINTCVLEGMSVDYTGGGRWQTFNSGAPTHIRLSLAFRELEPLTRAHIEGGY